MNGLIISWDFNLAGHDGFSTVQLTVMKCLLGLIFDGQEKSVIKVREKPPTIPPFIAQKTGLGGKGLVVIFGIF